MINPNALYVTQDDCHERRGDCKGIRDLRADTLEELHKIDKRLSRIEWVGVGIAAAYVFFSQILPTLQKWGQAAAATH